MDPNSGCWLWDGVWDKCGYPVVTQGTKKLFAHRVVYEQYVGPLGTNFSCHKCDTPACVNPAHLFSGTHADNMNDMKAKGRAAKGRYWSGEYNPKAKLNSQQRLEIIKACGTQASIAVTYGISQSMVSLIKRSYNKEVDS